MGRVWANKFEVGEAPIFGKNVFDSWGKLTPKMHAYVIIHPRPPLHSWFWELLGTSFTFLELFCIPHPYFYNCLHFPHDWEVRFVNLSAWALGLAFLLLFPRLGIHFVMPSKLEKRPWFMGICGGCFFPCEANEHLVKLILALGLFYPLSIFYFSFQDVFVHAQHCNCCVLN